VEVTNVQEAKTHLSRLLERVQDGNEILIGKAGKPIAKLVPFSPSDQPRQIGGWENQVVISEDFDELPPKILSAFIRE
jgi:prevent-host-death family protein